MNGIPKFSLRTTVALVTFCAVVFSIIAVLHRGVVRKQSALPGPTVEFFTGVRAMVVLPEGIQFNEDAIRQHVISNLPADSGFIASDVDVRELHIDSERLIDIDFNRFYRCYLAWDGFRYTTVGEAGLRNQKMHDAIRKTQLQLTQEYLETAESAAGN